MIHPSKFYGVLSAGRPFLFIGPKNSFISERINESRIGARINLNDGEQFVNSISQYRSLTSSQMTEVRKLARDGVAPFTREKVLPILLKSITDS